MPEMMFLYRAASYFARIFCSNITMGMLTKEEVEDIQAIEINTATETVREKFSEKRNDLVVGEVVEEAVQTPTVKTRNRRTKAEILADEEAERAASLGTAEPETSSAISEQAPIIPIVSDDDFPDPPEKHTEPEAPVDQAPPSKPQGVVLF